MVSIADMFETRPTFMNFDWRFGKCPYNIMIPELTLNNFKQPLFFLEKNLTLQKDETSVQSHMFFNGSPGRMADSHNKLAEE